MHTLFELLYKGALLGVITAFSFGPIFFTIIETSITRGHRLAISIAIGVLLSDILIITASFLSVGTLMQHETVSNAIGASGGALLLIFGLYHLWKPVATPKTMDITPASHFSHLLFIIKGLIINTLNPFVFIYWLSAVSIVSVDKDYNEAEKIMFFGAALLCNFFFDLVKTFLASRLKHLMTQRTMNFISKAVGCGIIYFGARLLWKTVVT
ncbi:MAG TPA: LysE family transporter [Chitinophagales bacterium]|nr:LysE family transporter [Chitinophagales bacterium]